MRRQLATIAAAAIGLLATACSPVAAWEQLTVLQPNLTASFGAQESIYNKPSLFGLPNFAKQISGQVIYPEPLTNHFGCLPYTPFGSDDPLAPVSGALIALIDRGGNCTFAQKVLNAQTAGAAAAIIVNDDAIYLGPLPYMGGGSSAITIPAMLIYGRDGAVLKKNVDVAGGLVVSMSYFLPNPDDRVEIDFYTSGVDLLQDTSMRFKRQFAEVSASLGKHALFTPHYQVLTGGRGFSCRLPTGTACTAAALDDRCGNRCTNCGRYCQNDPDKDTGTGASGSDVVMEQARQKCLWKYSNSTTGVFPPVSQTLWFSYVNGLKSYCAGAPSDFDEACSMKFIASLGVPTSFMTQCLSGLSYTTDAPAGVLQDEIAWMTSFQPLSPPQLFVNNQQYNGYLGCSDPIGTSCPALQMICAGFSDGTAPATCATSPGCPLGQVVDGCGNCGGDGSTCGRRTGKFPTGAVIGILILMIFVIGGGVYFYMRRQNNRMRDDIDSLLKQYLPLEGQNGMNGANKNGASAASREANTNLRLIGNLDSAGDEPTDL